MGSRSLLCRFLRLCILASTTLASLDLAASAQSSSSTGEWEWVGGSSAVPASCTGGVCGTIGVYGTLGSPAATNTPGGRTGAVSWTGSDGRFWLFGGNGRDAAGTIGYLNDLWVFDPSTRQWTWIAGSETFTCFSSGGCGQAGVYGTQGAPAPGNLPGSRQFASAWTSGDGHLWLFGGQGYAANGQWGMLNDLWEFDPTTGLWAWISGNNSVPLAAGNVGIYGTKGVAAPGNTPGSRYKALSWTGKDGRFWLYAGRGDDDFGDCAGISQWLSDLWVFDPSTRLWTWASGSDVCMGIAPVYGTVGLPSPDNEPGQLSGAVTWSDAAGRLWLFSGRPDVFGLGNAFEVNEYWAYDPSISQWAWMGGGNTLPVFGEMGVSGPQNVPGGVYGGSGWTDSAGEFWLFGGGSAGANINNAGAYPNMFAGGATSVLWKFDPAKNEWVWMNGSAALEPLSTLGIPSGFQPGVYGALGSAAFGNAPGGRLNAVTWTDSNGNLWLFGGMGWDATGNSGFLNDMWEFQPSLGPAPDSLQQVAAPTFNVQSGTYGSIQTVTISDSTPGTAIYITTDGSIPSPASNTYWGPITVAATETVQATAVAFGYRQSPIVTADYTINLPPPDFSFAASPGSLTMTSGETRTATLTITPQNGFTSPVTFACSGLPTNVTCAFTPSTITPSGSGATAQLTIAASVSASNVMPESRLFLTGASVMLATCFLFWRRRRGVIWWTYALLLSGGILVMAACGGSGASKNGSSNGGTNGSTNPPPPTQATVTITATSGSLTKTATIALSITH